MKIIKVSQENKEAGFKDFFNFLKSPSKKDNPAYQYINPALVDINESISDLISALVEIKKQKSYQTGMWSDPEHQRFWNDWNIALNYVKNTMLGVRSILKKANTLKLNKTSAYEEVDDTLIWQNNKKKIDFISDQILKDTVNTMSEAYTKLVRAVEIAFNSGEQLAKEWYDALNNSINQLEQARAYLESVIA